jgi:hypothetical protein
LKKKLKKAQGGVLSFLKFFSEKSKGGSIAFFNKKTFGKSKGGSIAFFEFFFSQDCADDSDEKNCGKPD